MQQIQIVYVYIINRGGERYQGDSNLKKSITKKQYNVRKIETPTKFQTLLNKT